MQPTLPSLQATYCGLRALKTVAIANGEFHPLEQHFIHAVQNHILKTNLPAAALSPISPEELASIVTDSASQQDILHGCILVSIIDGEPTMAQTQTINEFAQALNIQDDALKTLHHLNEHHLNIVRFDVIRNSFVGSKLVKELQAKGLGTLLATAKALLGQEDSALADRYCQLEHYPSNSLGKAYFDYMRQNGFALPGEKGGAPEIAVKHDCIHVLADYGTTVEEKVQAAGFQAAFLDRAPFWELLFVILEFHLGVQITPNAEPEKGKVDSELLLNAFERGSYVTTNLFDNLDPWAMFDQPLEEVRRLYNIPPRA